MRTSLAIAPLLGIMLFGAPVRAVADPLVVYYYPCGVQVGTTNRIIVGGQYIGGLRGGWISGDGVRVLDIERIPGFPLPLGNGQSPWVGEWLEAVLDGRPEDKPKLPPDESLRGWIRYPLWEMMDKLDPLELSLVARDFYTPRDALQMSPALSEMCIATIVADGNASPGARDIVLFDNGGASAPHPFYVSAEKRMPEPLFESPVRRKMRLAEQARRADSGLVEKTPDAPRPPVVFDGQIMPGETDAFRIHLEAGKRVVCALTARELLPYLGDAVPGFFNPMLHLKNASGHEIAFSDDFFFLPDPVLVCDIIETGDYVLEVHDNVYRGRQDFVYMISCHLDEGSFRHPTPQERSFAGFPPAHAHTPKPVADSAAGFLREGVVDMPGRSVAYEFEISGPATWEFNLFARRNGSPLDGLVKLYGPISDLPLRLTPLLASWDDVKNKLFAGSIPQVECDPIGVYSFTRPGRYRVVVSDAAGGGGDDFSYTLRAAPAAPAFEVYAAKSSFLLHPWNPRFSFKARLVRRNGFEGAVTFDEIDGYRFEQGTIPAGAEEATIVAVAKRTDRAGMDEVQFTVSADTPSGRITEKATPCDPQEQAFAYTHLLPARAFRCHMLPADANYAVAPEWIDMPKDTLFPPRVVFSHTNMPPVAKSGASSIDRVAFVDVVPVAPAPTADADDGVLALKFASSAARTVGRRGVVALDPGKNAAAAACAALAGIPRLVSEGCRHLDGDELRVRTLARAATMPIDNDALVYMASSDPSPLTGPVGAAARRLRDAGWCFDFATDGSLPERAQGYRAVYVPKSTRPMPDNTVKTLTDYAQKQGCAILFENAVPANAKAFRDALGGKSKAKFGKGMVAVGECAYLLGKDVSTPVRCETFCPEGVRFARYGTSGGEGWYFVHNPTRHAVSGSWRFNMRGNPQTAYSMNIGTGKISQLTRSGDGAFACSLDAGASAWIYLTARQPPPPGTVVPEKPRRRW